MTPPWDAVSREDLIAALKDAHRQLAALEQKKDEEKWLVDCLRKRTRELDERTRELRCLYRALAAAGEPSG